MLNSCVGVRSDLSPSAIRTPRPTPRRCRTTKDQGILKYAMPDKGLYASFNTDVNGKWMRLSARRIEHWLCDGNSVYEYKYPTSPNSQVR